MKVRGVAVTCAKKVSFSLTKRVFRSLILPVLTHSYAAWTLTGELKPRLNVFGTGGRTIISTDPVFREAGLLQVTCIVRERQLRLYGRMAQLPREDHTQIQPCRASKGLDQCRGASSLRQVELI